jgi:hypothetical protein
MADQDTYLREMAHWQTKLGVDARWQLNRRRHEVMREWRLRDQAPAKNAFWGAMLRPVAAYAVTVSLVVVSLAVTFAATEFSHTGLDSLGTATPLATVECKACVTFNGCYL